MEFQVRLFGHIFSFPSNRCIRVVADGKCSQEHPVNSSVLQGFILVPTLFLLYINDLPFDNICNNHSSQRGSKSYLKKHSHLKSQFPPEMTLLKSQQNFQSRLELSFLFTLISNICFKQFSRWRVKTGKQYYKLFQILYHYQTILMFSESYWPTILHTFPEFISSNTVQNNIDLFRAHIKQYAHFHSVTTKQ